MGRKGSRGAQPGPAVAGRPAGLVETAFAKLKAGRNKEAANLAKRAVKANPGDGAAQLILGVAQLDAGRPALALSPLRKAVQLVPGDPECHFQLGLVLRLLGERDAAIAAFTHCLSLQPDLAAAYQQLGVILLEAGATEQARDSLQLALRYDPGDALSAFNLGVLAQGAGAESEAIARYSQAVAADPKHAGAHINMGNIALAHGKLPLAAKSYRLALEAEPGNAIAHSNLGRVLKEQGTLEAAEDHCRKAAKLDPGLADAHNNLGNVLKERGDPRAAIACYKRALAIEPENGKVLFNLGDTHYLQHRYREAEQTFRRAIALDPGLSITYVHCGLALVEMGRLAEAVMLFEQAVAMEPDHAGYKCTLSQAMVTLGTQRGDQAMIEAAYGMADACFACGLRVPQRRFALPKWQGEPLAGKRLLLWREQGVGDEIRWASYYPSVIAEAAHCVIEADPRLVSVFAASFPGASVRPFDHGRDGTRDDADYHVPAYDLELLHKTGRRPVDDLRQRPWIQASAAAKSFWAERLAALPPGLKVGLCWRSGLSGRLRDPHYAALADWEPLLTRPDLQVVNLQYSDCEDEIRDLEAATGRRIHRWDDVDLKDDFDKVFGLLTTLDVVLAAPTAVPQMAAAVGCPSWVFLTGARAPQEAPALMPAARRRVWRRHVEESWRDLIARAVDSLS